MQEEALAAIDGAPVSDDEALSAEYEAPASQEVAEEELAAVLLEYSVLALKDINLTKQKSKIRRKINRLQQRHTLLCKRLHEFHNLRKNVNQSAIKGAQSATNWSFSRSK